MDESLILTDEDKEWAEQKIGDAKEVHRDLKSIAREISDRKYSFEKANAQALGLWVSISNFDYASSPEGFTNVVDFSVYYNVMKVEQDRCVDMILILEGVF